MTPDEKIAKDACDYLFRLGRHANAAVEFDPVGYLRHRLAEAIKAEREACAKIADEWGRREDYMNEAKTSFIPGADHSERFASSGIAAAIRARGATTK